MRIARNQTIPCTAIMGFYWAANAIYFAFVSAFLLDHGYSAFQVGIVNTSLYLVSSLLGPISGYITDSLLPPTRYIPLSMTVTIPFVLAMPLVVDSLAISLVCILAAAFCQNLLYGVIDSWFIKLREGGANVNYPAVRSMGSVSYSVSAAAVGSLIGLAGYEVIFPLNVFCCIMVSVCSFFIQPIPCSNRSSTSSQEQKLSFFSALKLLAKNFQFVAYVLSMLLLYIGLRMTLIFHPNLIFYIGGTSADLGISIFLSAFFEFPVMMFAAKFYRRFDPRKLAFVGILIGASKSVILLFAHSVPIFWLAQVTQAISIGMFLPLTVSYFRKIVPKQIYATSIMINGAMTSGLCGIFASFLGGILLERSRSLFLLTAIAFSLAAVLLFGLSLLKKFDNSNWYDT